jgi:hypothetical protein
MNNLANYLAGGPFGGWLAAPHPSPPRPALSRPGGKLRKSALNGEQSIQDKAMPAKARLDTMMCMRFRLSRRRTMPRTDGSVWLLRERERRSAGIQPPADTPPVTRPTQAVFVLVDHENGA